MNNKKYINKNLKLFFFSKNIGVGLPIWLSDGFYIYKKIKNLIYKININNNYEEVFTPHITKEYLFKKSGHLDKYYNNIFKINSKENLYIKPMNCPFHCEIYKFYKDISYKMLPKRYFEFGSVYRKEKSGEINNLLRTRFFTQDDGHIFCRNKKKQIYKEILNIIKNIIKLYKFFKFNKIYIRFSLRNKNKNNKYIGNNKLWKKSENIILYIKKIINIKYKYKNYIKYNDAAFYGPKIDFIIKDNNNRKWQLGTIQIDYNTPIRFNLKYINKYNKYKIPILIHRAYLGSIERFIYILIEHNKGNIPIFLLKKQLVIIPINNNVLNYSKKILNILIKKKIRTIIYNDNNNINKKIKINIKFIPIIFIIGEKEKNNKTISIIIKNKGNIGTFKIKKAIKYIINYINKIY
ncbi:MAG: hypothetical protein RDO_0890 [Flavobacteriales endosymbiont of Rhyzopertha dominica]|nr:MAG: His/Gly/Thr/Pro-type tRNA ligase C-terminal domain-containing protein [Candidatus Shikimatogenerans bostrichidophilus]